MSTPNVVIVGGGAAAISMAHTLKQKLGFNNFEVCLFHASYTNKVLTSMQIYEKREGLGGTWRVNTYPGWFVCLFVPICHFPLSYLLFSE